MERRKWRNDTQLSLGGIGVGAGSAAMNQDHKYLTLDAIRGVAAIFVFLGMLPSCFPGFSSTILIWQSTFFMS
jgi:hypothetical protein